METIKFILASASVTRRRLLENAGLSFDTVPAHIDEEEITRSLQEVSTRPYEIATLLAELKACKVSQKHPERVVIGGDQVLEISGNIFSKPRTKDQVKSQLLALRNNSHTLISSVCVAEDGRRVWHQTERALIQFRDFTDQFLEHYLITSEKDLFNGPGGYKLEGQGIRLVEKLEGDYFTILGLPLLPLLKYFSVRGFVTS